MSSGRNSRTPQHFGTCIEQNYYLPVEAYRDELQSAGFSSVTVHGLLAPPQGASEFAPGFWDELLAHPVFIVLDCVRADVRG